jgi:type IV pilus assembly protein PilC
MALFAYELINETGARIKGTQEAIDRFALYRLIKKQGVTILSAKEVKKKGKLSSLNINLPFLSGVKTHDKITFAKNLGKMIEAGLPITKGLAIMEKEASSKQFKKILSEINQSITRGETLSDSLKMYPDVFSQLFISMVKAGEESGKISLALDNVSIHMEKSYQLNRKILGALVYPGVILTLMLGIGVVMMIYVVPSLTDTFTGLHITLPLSTRIIIATSNFLKNDILFVLLGLVFLGIGFFYLKRTKGFKRFFDKFLLEVPIIKGMVKGINSARTARTLSSLVSSGVPIVSAISTAKDVLQNSFYKEVLEEMQDAVQKGDSIHSVFSKHEDLYPAFVDEMTAVGEETGKIGEMLLNVALFYEEEIDQKTKDMSSIVEPFLMIAIGLAVAFFAISMISPIYSIGDSIK